MMDWDKERREIREFLQPRCHDYQEFEFWDYFFDDLTDMFDGLFDGHMSNDPVLWAHFSTADNTADQHAAFVNAERFRQEVFERGYNLEEM